MAGCAGPVPQAVVFGVLVLFAGLAAAQRTPTPTPAAAAPAPDPGCNGIQLTYNFESRTKIRPYVADRNKQPYSFKANATVLNSGTRPLKSWAMLVTFGYGEILVGVDGAVLTGGGEMPYNTTGDAGNATSFSGYPQTDLLTPIATAGDISRIQASVGIVGTLFAGPEPFVPLPTALSLDDPAYACPAATNVSSGILSTCCVLTPEAEANATVIDVNATDPTKNFLPRRTGDLVITYDVLQAYPSSYLALVTLENNAKLGRLDNWRLSWEWRRGEFIYSMKGAYPLEKDTSGCIYGPAGQYYKDLDFSQVLNCDKKPVILDLPLSRYNDTQIGKIDHCCRNGTILPKSMDEKQSKSAFQMQVFKMPPDLNRTKLFPPANFKIAGASSLNPDYTCGQPVPVSPTEFPDPSGLDSTTLAIATWQVVCNITTSKAAKPKCCVTFSAYYNDSVIPCNTCACGCPAKQGPTCSTTAQSMMLPPEALLVPFDNRTQKALAWAELKHYNVPRPKPCGDYCGVSINWHISTDYNNGWSARMTLFNWDNVDLANWFAAIVMDKAYDGFEKAYSFNSTTVGQNTIFMQGLEGLNYLVKQTNMSGSDYLVPGKQQSVLSFSKKLTPGINVVAGDGFPSKVFFNGDECSMPQRIPMSNSGFRTHLSSVLSLVLVLAASAFVLLHQ
ncbi:COBRA-like protein 7 [Oryza brachyantha]|uniref:COBRA-like protein 7 n=1 Tax=Oryza brachyantha TaxID=4533 RepID=UPI001ADBE4CF|nr:COBRA-like protein 7 [Oryza brachyantha]